jgi:protein PET100
MLYFGGPDFYNKHVRGINFWPEFEKTHVSSMSTTEKADSIYGSANSMPLQQPPKTSDEVRAALDQMKSEREDRWMKKAMQARQEKQQQAGQAASSNVDQA